MAFWRKHTKQYKLCLHAQEKNAMEFLQSIKKREYRGVGEYTYMYNIQKDMHQRGQQGEVPRLRDRIRIGECEMVIFHMCFSSQRAKIQGHLKVKKIRPTSTCEYVSRTLRLYVKAYVNV